MSKHPPYNKKLNFFRKIFLRAGVPNTPNSKLFGVTDGKAVGTYNKKVFQESQIL
jgi:hypothetical protein